MRISDWSSDVCSSDLFLAQHRGRGIAGDDRPVEIEERGDMRSGFGAENLFQMRLWPRHAHLPTSGYAAACARTMAGKMGLGNASHSSVPTPFERRRVILLSARSEARR